MKYIINHLQKIYFILFSLFTIGIIFIQFNIIELNSIIGHLIGYLLPSILILNLIHLFLICKKKLYTKIITNSLTTTISSVISFFIFLFLTKLKLINPLLGYVFIYLVFPNMILVFLISILILYRGNKKIIIKNHFKKSFIWLLILIIGLILNKYIF
jgi:hypothetical protein